MLISSQVKKKGPTALGQAVAQKGALRALRHPDGRVTGSGAAFLQELYENVP